MVSNPIHYSKGNDLKTEMSQQMKKKSCPTCCSLDVEMARFPHESMDVNWPSMTVFHLPCDRSEWVLCQLCHVSYHVRMAYRVSAWINQEMFTNHERLPTCWWESSANRIHDKNIIIPPKWYSDVILFILYSLYTGSWHWWVTWQGCI